MTNFTKWLESNYPVKGGLLELEAQYIEYTHTQCRFNQSKTARVLGLSRGTLRSKLREYFPGKYLI